ncbi:MarR family transcriptional regulator [Polymorphospora lycopeni]|uniref:MarR family transcriptional regulator n=1 Tax=Polymorphospora lycopeni TaxID=3140240 RepID=A0ABV5CRY3_9ACTN
MENPTSGNTPPTTLDKVAAAIAELGEATAAAIAAHAGIGYSTATKRLRALEDAGLAQPFRADDGRTLWKPVGSTGSGGEGVDERPDGEPSSGQPEPTGPHAPPEAAPDDDSSGPESVEHDHVTSAGQTDDETAHPSDPTAPAANPEPDGEKLAAVGEPQDVAPAVPGAPDAGNQDEPAVPAAAEEPATEGDGRRADLDQPVPADGMPQPTPALVEQAATGKARRAGGSLRGAILDVLEADPDRQFKTSELCKAIDKANEGTGAAKASAGAVVNALHKLVTAGAAIQTVERPATFRLAPKTA